MRQGARNEMPKQLSMSKPSLGGALSWHAQQVAPHISAEVGLLLSEVKVSTVETLLRTKGVIYSAKKRQDHCLLVHHFPEDTDMGFFMWADAAGDRTT